LNFSFSGFLSTGNQVSGAIAKLRKATVGFVVSVRMQQLGSHLTDFREILYFEDLSKIFRKKSSFIEICQVWRVLYMKTNVQLWPYLAQFFVKWKVLEINVVEKIETFHVQKLIFPKIVPLWDNVQKFCRALKTTDDSPIRRMRIACWITKAVNTRSEYVIFIAFPLPQWLHVLCLSGTLYVHWLSCLYLKYSFCRPLDSAVVKYIDAQSERYVLVLHPTPTPTPGARLGVKPPLRFV